MARISKMEQAQRAERKVRGDEARQSILEQMGKLLDKHVENLIKTGVATDVQITLKIDGDGRAAMRLTYQTVITDGAGFDLDDGQEEMPLGKTETPATGE